MAGYLDPTDPDFIADPYPALGALRERGAVLYDEAYEMWLVTRHTEVRAAQLDRRLGRVKDRYARPADLRPIRVLDLDDWEPYYRVERHSLLLLEPPDHTRIRKLINSAFTPRRVRELRKPITVLARDLVAPLRERETFDLLADFAGPYSIQVIATLLGAPVDDTDLMLEWSHAIVKMYELHCTRDQAVAAVEASREFAAWTEALVATRRSEPRDDLISALCEAETAEGGLTDDEIISTVILLLNAGHEATVNTIGNGVVAALDQGTAWRRLAQGEVSTAIAIEEMMRFDSPLQIFERLVLEDGVEIAGVPIPKGDKVAVLFGAANRDPRRFDSPDEFRIERGDTGHITFGAGVHHCIGAPLARLELEIALDHLVAALPHASLVARPEREEGFAIRGYRTVDLASGQ